jgi:hypothetical protein
VEGEMLNVLILDYVHSWTFIIILSNYFPPETEFDADDPLGDLLSDEDDDPSKTKKKDIFKSNLPESTKKQESESDPLEPKNKQNRAKVMAELFGLEEEKKQLPKQSQSDRDSSSSWLGLKDPLPTENKTLEVAKAASQTHGQGTIQCGVLAYNVKNIRLAVTEKQCIRLLIHM